MGNKEDKKEGDIEEKEKRENNEESGDGVEEPAEINDRERKENKQLKKIFFIIGILALFFLGVFLVLNSSRKFTYEGVDFEMEKYCDSGPPCLTVYRTSLPVNSNKKFTTGKIILGDYNFYLRNDPRKLKDLPVEGELTLMPNLVINFTEDFKCGGPGVIAVVNLGVVLDVLDVKVITDETAGCDPDGRYTFLRLQTGNETSIEQFGPSCYNLNINNCEVLEVTEKYIVELLSEVTKNRLQ
jgi:hypothetical protein